jgi:pimeloyl-ACP methyl ester carboxylesterase
MFRIRPNLRPAFKNADSRARYMAAYDAVLQNWPVPYDELDLVTNLGGTHVIASGLKSAPPLILLPSFAASATVWRVNVVELSRHYRTYAVDVIGQPGKSLATKRIRARRQYTRWLIDVMDRLAIKRTSIVGCSFGGFLAMNQAISTPDRVERVVLISPVGVFASQYWKLFVAMRLRAPFRKLARRVTRSREAPSMEDLRRKSVFAMPRDANWAAQMGVTMSEAPKVSVIKPTVFSNAQLRSVGTPTLLLIGENESLYEPRATLKMAQQRMPQLHGAVVPGADHIAAMSQPEEVSARILAFLGKDHTHSP